MRRHNEIYDYKYGNYDRSQEWIIALQEICLQSIVDKVGGRFVLVLTSQTNVA